MVPTTSQPCRVVENSGVGITQVSERAFRDVEQNSVDVVIFFADIINMVSLVKSDSGYREIIQRTYSLDRIKDKILEITFWIMRDHGSVQWHPCQFRNTIISCYVQERPMSCHMFRLDRTTPHTWR